MLPFTKLSVLKIFLPNDLADPNQNVNIKDHEKRLREINTLEWDELLVQDDPNKLISPQEGNELGYLQ